MPCLSPQTNKRRLRERSLQAGFTLVEIMVALSALATVSAGCYIGFNAINTYAVTSRLFSEAQTGAQNQIDLILSKGPFDITAANISGTFNPALNKIPIELMTVAELDALVASGVALPTSPPTSVPPVTSSYYPYYPYYRTGTGGLLSKEAFIYQDPVTGKVVVTGTLVNKVATTSASMTFAGTTSDLNVRKATATVSYTFKNKNYDVAMDTLRTADQ